MREVQGTLSIEYSPKDPVVFLGGHRQPYLFDNGLELDLGIAAGADITLTLITVPGPNPARSFRTCFDVERIAGVRVNRVPAVRLQLVG